MMSLTDLPLSFWGYALDTVAFTLNRAPSKFVETTPYGHDEESRNGRDIKIDILDDYIQSLERFRVIRVFFRVSESYGNSPGSIWALLGFSGKRERGAGHLLLVLIGLREGEVVQPPWAAPFSFPVRPMKAHMAPGGFR